MAIASGRVRAIFQRPRSVDLQRYCLPIKKLRGTKVLYIDQMNNARLMLAAEAKTGVRHHVGLPIVGSERANDT